MKTQPPFEMYLERMQEIVRRLEVVEALINGKSVLHYLPPTIESIYLQFRHVLELIATASLSVNQQATEELIREGIRKWHAGDILNAIETVNPDYYYPYPLRLIKGKSELEGIDWYKGELKDFDGDYLTREKFATLYDKCSKILHTPNPFDRKAIKRNLQTDKNHLLQATKWHKRIIELLKHHKFRPVGQPEIKFYLCYTHGPSNEFRITEFVRMDVENVSDPAELANERDRFLHKKKLNYH